MTKRLKKKFQLISWQDDFLKVLLDELYEEEGSDLSNHLFILPHSRPQMYMEKALKYGPKRGSALILPRFSTISEIFSQLHQNIFMESNIELGKMDCIALLLDCVRSLPEKDFLFSLENIEQADSSNDPDFEKFLQASKWDNEKKLEAQFFFPWGLKLAALFEESFIHNIIPANFYPDDERLSPYAAKLMEQVRTIFDLYLEGLKKRSSTTAGLNAFKVARYLDDKGEIPAHIIKKVFHGLPKHKNKIHIAGFFALSGAEEKLLHYLWSECEASVFLHGDNSQKAHWSSRPLYTWAKKWGAGIDRISASDDKELFNNIKYTCGFDLHSQLNKVKEILSEGIGTEEIEGYAADTAVILPDTALLMPVLHHLPHTDINISMGYPLQRSPLFTLLDQIFSLHENSRHGLFYWKDLLAVARHPYIKMLSTKRVLQEEAEKLERENQEIEELGTYELTTKDLEAEELSNEERELSLRRELHKFEEELRKGQQAFASPFKIFENLYLFSEKEDTPNIESLKLLIRLKKVLLDNFKKVKNCGDMAKALQSFCRLLLEHGSKLWVQFPIDAECLYRLYQSIIPELSHSELAKEEFPQKTIFFISRSLLKDERVPFEATPLVGLQLMGMLESRLLNFRRVIIPEAVDELIPGVSYGDPLLPEPLRLELGLPGKNKREEVAAYHFFRLLAGALEVHLLWQEGSESSSLIDAKKSSSRFIEELLWEEEKKRKGRLFNKEGLEAPLETLSTSVGPLIRRRSGLIRSTEMKARINELMARPISSTLLDNYIRCPASFALGHILKISEPDEVLEDRDPLTVGKIIHAALHEFYGMHMNTPLPEGKIMAENYGAELVEVFKAQPAYASMRETMPADVFTAFATAGDLRLQEFLLNQPETKVISLEKKIIAPFYHSELDKLLSLSGQLDRIDERKELRTDSIQRIVLDYKTGYIPDYRSKIWEMEKIWSLIDAWEPGKPADEDPLFYLSDNLSSIQLAFYIFQLSLLDKETLLTLFGYKNKLNLEDDFKNHLNAAWVNLAGEGKEKYLFSYDDAFDIREEVIEIKIPKLISFIIKHMVTTRSYSPIEGRHCDWCSFAGRCVVKM